MQVDFTDDELAALRDLIDRHVSNMYAEISHTDNPAFRAGLRDERAVLQSIRTKLSG